MHSILPHTENKSLRSIAKEIRIGDIPSVHTKKLIATMKKLLAEESLGVALAAPQIGESVRLFIVSGTALQKREESDAKRGEADVHATDESALPITDEVYINPVLKKLSRARSDKHEGCLSIRGKWGIVKRSEKATIEAYDEHGKKFTKGASGFLAHIYQHEMDHLDGILYIDKAKDLYDDEPGTEETHET